MEKDEYTEAITKVRDKGYKITPQRLEIIRTLVKGKLLHPTLDEILSLVRKKVETVSFSTLYSTVLLLKELGIVEVFEFGGKIRVETRTTPHINIIKASTGEVVDLHDDELIKEIMDRLKSHGISAERMLINVIVY